MTFLFPKLVADVSAIARDLHQLTTRRSQAATADRATTAGPRLDNAAVLLVELPLGEYLLTRDSGRQLLWRISEGEPPDGALEPAESWTLAR
jgi:hypothetical protein